MHTYLASTIVGVHVLHTDKGKRQCTHVASFASIGLAHPPTPHPDHLLLDTVHDSSSSFQDF